MHSGPISSVPDSTHPEGYQGSEAPKTVRIVWPLFGRNLGLLSFSSQRHLYHWSQFRHLRPDQCKVGRWELGRDVVLIWEGEWMGVGEVM